MQTRLMRTLASLPFLLLIAVAVTLACGGDGDDEEHIEHMAPPGVVSPKPSDATQVNVTLREWAVAPGQSSIAAGRIYFLASNVGPDHPHEMVIIRSDLSPLNLPFRDNKVPEEEVDVVDEIEEFAPRSSASLTVNLTPGKYLLICNISEEDPQIGSHYKKGMVAGFTVE